MDNQSTLSIELLKKYVNKYNERIFIETGTAKGEGVQVALDYGFEKIISIEVNSKMFAEATARFAKYSNVLLACGGSRDVLPMMLSDIHEPAVFWLDAHWSTGEDPLMNGVLPCPLLAELNAIKANSVKDHLILIDDIRYFKKGIEQWHNINLGDIIDGVMAINKDYWVTFEPGVSENDILIAKVLK